MTQTIADTLEVYKRRFPGETCTQLVLVQEGKIVAQNLVSDAGSYYTGDGNPEFIGENKSILRGKNFTKSRAGKSERSKNEHDIWKLDLYSEITDKGKEN